MSIYLKHVDCMSELPNISDSSIGLILSDIPVSTEGLPSVVDWIEFFKQCYRVLIPGRVMGLSCDSCENEVKDLARIAGFDFLGEVEWKSAGLFITCFSKGETEYQIREVPTVNDLNGFLKIFIWSFSEISDIVLDPFSGIGSTVDVAHNEHRAGITYDIDESMCKKVSSYLGLFRDKNRLNVWSDSAAT